MTSAYGYDKSAGNNTSAAPDGMPEGMPPSGVNDWGRKHMANFAEFIFMGVAGGTADALTLTPTNSVVAYVDGMKVSFRASATNTLTNPTLAISGLTARTIVKNGGSALAAGDITNLGAYDVQYNLANTRWELMNPKQQSVSLASTTEVLTGTDTAKAVTADALAALWEQGSDVASAGTISLGEGGYFNITGTTTITDIDFGTDKAGRKAWVKFAGALTLTHNATTLILPAGANITTAAGDTACFVSEGADAVRCVAYNRAAGTPLAISIPILIYEDQKTDGTVGGTATTGAWTKHALGTEVRDTSSLGSVSSDVITLAAGTYDVSTETVHSFTGGFRSRFRDTTNSATYALSTTGGGGNPAGQIQNAVVVGKDRFTISGSTNFELQYFAEATNSTSDLGDHDGVTAGVEVYARVTLLKVA